MAMAYHGDHENWVPGHCTNTDDTYFTGMYYGMNYHPYELIFYKSNRHVGKFF